jgi:hypothetical protein
MSNISRYVATSIVIFLIGGSTATARLDQGTSLAGFLGESPCALLGKVISTETLDEPRKIAEDGSELWLVKKVVFQVEEEIGACREVVSLSSKKTIDLRFSIIVQASDPAEGETAILFPGHSDGVLTERFLGSSYWPLEEHEGKLYVFLSWRNYFLLDGIRLSSGEAGLVSASAVLKYLREVLPADSPR